MHPARLDRLTLQQDCSVRRQRRGGPGGQHRNKVETGVFLVHTPTGVHSEATERRSQEDNLVQALERLRTTLALEVRWPEVSGYPSPLWLRRCRQGQLSVSRRHVDFAALLAEALDVLAHFGWQTRPAAEYLQCSASQLVRFLKQEPRGLLELNRRRKNVGLRPLR